MREENENSIRVCVCMYVSAGRHVWNMCIHCTHVYSTSVHRWGVSARDIELCERALDGVHIGGWSCRQFNERSSIWGLRHPDCLHDYSTWLNTQIHCLQWLIGLFVCLSNDIMCTIKRGFLNVSFLLYNMGRAAFILDKKCKLYHCICVVYDEIQHV